MSVTIKDVAKLANVSISTVSRVLNGNVIVSQEKVDRVMAAAEQLQFVPSAIAQSLKHQKTHKIGMLVSDLSVSFFPGILSILEQGLAEDGFQIIAANCYDNPDTEIRLIENMVRDRVDALLVNPSDCNTERLQEIQNSGIPILSYDRHPSSHQFPSVYVDKAKGIYDLLCYLYMMGHRRFCFITGPKDLSTNVDRLLGIQKFIQEYKIPEENFDCFYGKYSSRYGCQIFQETAFEKDAPTAYVAGSISIMEGIVEYCNQVEIRIPEDVSLACFGTFRYANLVQPKLLHVDDEYRAIAEQLLVWLRTVLIDEKQLSPNVESVIIPKLVLGNSCGAPRKGNLNRKL